jgi:hypothetical protein
MRQTLNLVLLLWFLLCAPALAQSSGARPSGFFPDPISGGDSNATYFVLDANPNLNNERLLTFTDNFNVTDNGAGMTYVVDLATVPLADGGTGATTQQGAVNNILNFSGKASGDIVYYNGTNWVRLPIGSDTQVLTLASGLPTWSSAGAGAPANATYIVQSLNGTLSAERVATGTANRIVLTDGGANGNMTWDIGTDVVTLTGTQTLTNKTLTGPLFSWNSGNGVTLRGQTFNSVLNWADFTSAKTITFPDITGTVVLTAGAQTIGGVKTFSSAPTLTTGTLTAGANLQTFPSTAQTLVGRTSTDTLTNKTLTTPSFSASSLTLLQSSGNYTVSWQNPSSARAYTIRETGTDGHFAMTTTGATYSNGGIGYANGAQMLFSAAGTSGQVLLSGGAGAPSFGTVAATAGGTGQTTYAVGDTLYASSTTALSKRTIGGTGDFYVVAGGVPTWATRASLALPAQSNGQVDGRLTLVSGNPTGEATGATSLYYTPYRGNRIDLYNGSVWVTCTFSQITQSLTGLTINSNYDVFVYDSNADNVADTLDLVIWTNDSTRATTPVLQDGIYCKSGALGRRYVGTIRTIGAFAGCSDDAGLAGTRYVSNYYNQVLRTNGSIPTTASGTYTYASTIVRNWNNTFIGVDVVKCGLDDPSLIDAQSCLWARGADRAFNYINCNAGTQLAGYGGIAENAAADIASMPAAATFKLTGYGRVNFSEYTNGSTMTFFFDFGTNTSAGPITRTMQ